MARIDKVEFEKSRAIEQAIENWKMYEALMSALKQQEDKVDNDKEVKDQLL